MADTHEEWHISDKEFDEIASYYASKGEAISREQVATAIDAVAAIMEAAEQEFRITVTEELVSSWYTNLPPEPAPQSLVQE